MQTADNCDFLHLQILMQVYLRLPLNVQKTNAPYRLC